MSKIFGNAKRGKKNDKNKSEAVAAYY